jgi:hypothetical protein
MNKPTKDDLVKEAAAERIFASRNALFAEQRALKVRQEELAAREREIDRELAECRAAARFFGLDFEPPGSDRELSEIQAKIHNLHMQLRDAALRNSRPEVNLFQARITHLQTKLKDLVVRREHDETQRSLTFSPSEAPPELAPALIPVKSKQKMPKVRDIALDRLREARDAGQKASAIQRYIENTYSIKIHDKTVGMTLYRLLKSRLVHRKGQTWFLGSSSVEHDLDEKEDPGTSVPGFTQNVFEEA